MARPTNALIVDDEPHVRAFLRLLLKELGITACWEAADGQSAIDMTLAEKPELVLLDLNMPILSGMQVLAALREQRNETPVVIVTAQGAVSAVSEAVRLGAVGYVLKHAPKEDALEALRDVLDQLEDDIAADEPSRK